MSTQEMQKRGLTINDDLDIHISNARLIHQFLFGNFPQKPADSSEPTDALLPPDAPFFDRMIQIQVKTNVKLNIVHDILNEIIKRLEIDQSPLGGKAVGVSASTYSKRPGGGDSIRPFQPEERSGSIAVNNTAPSR